MALQPTTKSGPPAENVSATALPEPGVRPTRTLHRDPLGRFANRPLAHADVPAGDLTLTYARRPELVGPLNKPTGPGGRDSVTGAWIPGVRNNAQLHDLERVHAVTTRPQYHSPDYGWGTDLARKSHDGLGEAEQLLNHHLGAHHPVPSADCPLCNGELT